ncbi:pre-mRNA-splicing factor syf1 [Puccinia graminis f. sp. tritici]|uniref:Pre-mRNA-splicing factor SYF1 n=1 Tax=Puccinia graminis f. sp. tritici TaxID=56615 RepID=A0A5B0NSK0_PUCGR|nr:pre-mRNA-splicing factor syf1 [Puccinia graminis f. sp. tritici]KAA1092191.1 pre-mRNA-splicing factor syf1 [Puccinia graminis f. sp. tritici]
MEELRSLFPITSDLKKLLQTTQLTLSNQPEHLLIEQDLLTNPNNQSLWNSYIHRLTEELEREIKEQRGKATQIENQLLGNKLETETGRRAYQILVSVYERALIYFPKSFKLWKDYLQLRQAFILGQPKKKFNPSSNKKKQPNDRSLTVLDHISKSDDQLEDNERDMDGGGGWSGHLDGGLGWLEWKALASAHERSLTWLPQMPRLWLSYLTLLTHPSCPAPLSLTHTRHTFDRALRTLPHTLHERIWKPYLRWSEQIAGGETCIRVWRRYLAIDPSLTAHYVKFLVGEAEASTVHRDDDDHQDDEEEDEEEEDDEDDKGQERAGKASHPSKALVAAKLLLGLVRKARRGKYKSPDGKSPYQLLLDFIELCDKFPSQVGISLKETLRRRQKPSSQHPNTTIDHQDSIKDATSGETPAPFNGLIRIAGAPVPLHPSSTRDKISQEAEAYDPDTDPANPSKLDIEQIVEMEGLSVYKDQIGLIFTNLATYWIKRAEFDRAKETFEAGIARVMTIRDFTTIFDAYAEFSEQYISTLMDSLGENSEGEDGEGGKSSEELELDQKMKEFEELMDRRPFLVNDVLLRRNPNDVQEWEKRVVLYGEDQDEKVVETYLKAIETINPKKATSNFNQLFIHFAKWYEENGVDPSDDSLPDLDSARKVFERAINVNFQRVDDLAEIWIEWAEMEVRNEKYTEALRVIRRATTVPPNHKKKAISFHDESLAVQVRLFKSLKLWSFRVDLEESIGTVESTQKAYDTIFELKIANAQIVVNYGNFLEENEYWEESFKVYERGIELFTYPIVFEIWNTYLNKFMKRYQGTKIERARDLFEQALENCPEKFVKPIFLSYAQLEESFGLAKRAMGVLERATEKVALDDRFEMFAYYIAKATENFGLPATRPIYEKAIKSLPNNQTAEMCLRFANLEQKLGEIDRARAIYAHSSQFCDPRTSPKFWETYHNFEIQHGSEDTFREMLRIKRAVQASFNTETSYLAAKAAAARAAGNRGGGATVSQQQDEDDETGSGDPMRRLEKDDSTTAGNQAFVLSKDRQAQLDRSGPPNPDQQSTNTSANVDEIAIDDDDD